MSDTPRTDAAEPKLDSNAGGWVRADFARQLERELAASKAEVERLTEQLFQAVEIAEWYMDNLVSSPRKDKLEAIKLTLKPTK